MRKTLVVLGTLGLAAALPTAAFADDHDRDHGRDGDRQERRDDRRDDRDGATFRLGGISIDLNLGSSGHYETREVRRVVPAVVRQEWVPERVEEICIPAVTERVCIPAVTERVFVPAVYERREIPARTERQFVPGHYETGRNVRGVPFRVWVEARYEVRIVAPARCEQVEVTCAHYEERVIRPAREEVRIVRPERRERRVVEAGHYCSVVVCAERTEVVRERVWVQDGRDDRFAFGRR